MPCRAVYMNIHEPRAVIERSLAERAASTSPECGTQPQCIYNTTEENGYNQHGRQNGGRKSRGP
ncbi:hypothetical protein PHLCEN_2v5689 [Hermanssonia centrifuga]|uniref:Uncharacterized protein n=1 Tax=Hermanssonia centrifuga TaxID=98765 RepID=A0A2R6P1N0_9APHY|nr:hypothetical protein PHLCEN_2v5689 [Hermanssonia centrifuga]